MQTEHDYISRNEIYEFLDLMESVANVHYDEIIKGVILGTVDAIRKLVGLVKKQDVVPVAHGRWNRDKDGLVWCCLCGFGQERSEDRPYAYCPNCGARMEKDGDGE